jgi:hypothetical protein
MEEWEEKCKSSNLRVLKVVAEKNLLLKDVFLDVTTLM